MSTTPFNPMQLIQAVWGYRPACVIGAAAELDLWTTLGGDSLDLAEICRRLGSNPRATEMLLDALVAIDMLEKHDGRYNTPPAMRDALTEHGAGTMLPMLQHLSNVLRGWVQLAWTVKSGIPAPRPSSIRGPDADRRAFIAAMHSISGLFADALIARLAPAPFKHLLDVGGASGTWTMALLDAVPDARATIFDLPDAIEQARERTAQTNYAPRVVFAAGDFYRDELPGGVDFAWVSAIVHQHDRPHNRDLFAKVHRALLPGGTIAIRDIVMESDRTKPVEGAMFAINMLVNTETGGTFTFEELAEDLTAVGFADPQMAVKGEVMDSVVMATKPQGPVEHPHHEEAIV